MHEIKSEVKTDSFSAKIVYLHLIPDLLKQSNCENRGECVLSFEIENSEHKLEVSKKFWKTLEIKN